MDYPPINNRQDGISSNRQLVSDRVSGRGQFRVYISQLAWTDSGAEAGERTSVDTGAQEQDQEQDRGRSSRR